MSSVETERAGSPADGASAVPAADPPRAAGPSDAQGHASEGRAQTAAQAKRSGARLAWLDALRGFAAMCVVFDHTGYHILTSQRNFIYQWFDPGQYGVFVFFLVSGYIIPASLERKGSMRGFWVSRLFRLYPLYLVAIVLSVVGAEHGIGSLSGAQHHPATSLAAWALMIPDILLRNTNIPNVAWTLSFEMVFYMLVACLYSWKKHKASGTYALGLSAAAVIFGGMMPMSALLTFAAAHGQMGIRLLCGGADVLILGGIVLSAVYSRKGGVVLPLGKIGATIAAATGLILLLFNESYPYPFSGFVILALMFTGTLIYRMEQGEARKVRGWAIVAAVFVLTMTAGLWHGDAFGYGGAFLWQWATCLVATAITFGVGMACRNLKLPAWLAWLGLVSYSIYLLHPLVIDVYEHYAQTVTAGTGVQSLIFIGFVAVVLAVSGCGYYWVEKPMVSLGRKFSRRVGG